MNIQTALTAAAVAVAGTSPLVQPAAAADGQVDLVRLCVNEPRYWQTAYTNEIPVVWKWGPTNAVSATLVYQGMNASGSNTFAAADGDASFFLPDGASEEDLYTLTLRFFDKDGAALTAVTSCVACVHGVARSGEVTLPVLDVSSPSATLPKPKAWPRVRRPGTKTDNVVLAYDSAWLTNSAVPMVSLTLAKQNKSRTSTATLAAPSGWTAWKLSQSNWGHGWFSVTLAAAGMEMESSVYRPEQGFVLSIR